METYDIKPHKSHVQIVAGNRTNRMYKSYLKTRLFMLCVSWSICVTDTAKKFTKVTFFLSIFTFNEG